MACDRPPSAIYASSYLICVDNVTVGVPLCVTVGIVVVVVVDKPVWPKRALGDLVSGVRDTTNHYPYFNDYGLP